jgi:hypothetical protein
MIITSRPAGLQKTRFAGFQQLSLSPLSFDQQKTAVQQRLGVELSEALMPYLESVPRDADTGQRITANPLMLSMVVSVFEIRQGLGMPKTIHELYAVASSAMLARGGGAPGKQLQLLRAVFFEAHLAQRREIEDRQLDEAALQLEMPRTLAAIRECAELDTHFDEEAKT